MTENIVTYTSINTYLYANNTVLGFVQSIDIEDVVIDDAKYTDITLHRLVNDHEDIINDMRKAPFTFKMANEHWCEGITHGDAEEISGYYSPQASVISFKMHLSAKKDGEENHLLEQVIVIRAKSFLYVKNICFDEVKAKDEDLKNLIEVLKKNQAAAHKINNDLKPQTYVIPGAVLPGPMIKYGVPGNDQKTIEKLPEFETTLKGALKYIKKYAELVSEAKQEVRIDNEDMVWLNAKDPEQIKDVKPRKLKKKNKK